MNGSIHANNDNCFLSILSAQPQEPITCNIWRFIFYIGFYGTGLIQCEVLSTLPILVHKNFATGY